MPGARTGGSHQAIAEINVTPFVDVMLVLLIIFMVTAPLLQQGLDVDLPETTTQPLHIRDDALVLTVMKDGKIRVANSDIPLSELEVKLKAILDGLEGKQVFLRADRKVRYGVVVKVMAAARLAGAKKLGIVTEPD